MPKKDKKPSTRDPMFHAVRTPQYRSRVEKSTPEKEERKDPLSRKAKHKNKVLDEAHEPARWTKSIRVDTHTSTIHDAETGEALCTYRLEKKVGWNIGLRKKLAELTGRIILNFGESYHIVGSWDEAADYLKPETAVAKAPVMEDEGPKPQSLSEFYQIGDRFELVSGPVKKIIARAEKLRKEKEAKKAEEEGEQPPEEKAEEKKEGVIRTFGPEGTLGVTIDGEYHLIDPEDAKLIYEAYELDFEDLVEWSYTTTTAGFQIPISSEEQSILDKCSEKMYKSELDDREQEVARLMVSKGVLHRSKDDSGLYFKGATKKLKRF